MGSRCVIENELKAFELRCKINDSLPQAIVSYTATLGRIADSS